MVPKESARAKAVDINSIRIDVWELTDPLYGDPHLRRSNRRIRFPLKATGEDGSPLRAWGGKSKRLGDAHSVVRTLYGCVPYTVTLCRDLHGDDGIHRQFASPEIVQQEEAHRAADLDRRQARFDKAEAMNAEPSLLGAFPVKGWGIMSVDVRKHEAKTHRNGLELRCGYEATVRVDGEEPLLLYFHEHFSKDGRYLNARVVRYNQYRFMRLLGRHDTEPLPDSFWRDYREAVIAANACAKGAGDRWGFRWGVKAR